MPIQNSISNVIKGSIINGGGPGADFSTKSLSFDGVDDYVEVADSDNLSFGNGTTDSPFSISTWWKMDNANGFRGVQKYSSSYEYRINTIGSSGILKCQLYDNSNTIYIGQQSNVGLSSYVGQWIHVVMTYDGSSSSSGIKLYLNGSLFASSDDSNGSYTAMHNTTSPFRLGKLTTSYANGLIDETAIFNSELSASDVVSIYNNGKPADLTSLNPLAWYRAGENSTFAYPQILMPENTNKDKVSKYSLAFDGTSDYIDCGDPDEFSFGNGTTDSRFSLSAWVKMTDASKFRIISKYASSNQEYLLSTDSTDKILFTLYDDSTGGTISRKYNTALTSFEGQWIHLAFTYSGNSLNSGLKIYLNGTQVDNLDNGTGSYTAMKNTTAPLEIGKLTTSYANGKIDEAAIFPVELSQLDVQAIYNSGVPTDISSYSPVGYWKLGEEAKFTDNWLVPNSALSNFSKYSFNFDGIDDYVSIPTITLPTDFSVSMWVKATTSGSVRDQVFGGASGFFLFGTVVLNGGANANKMCYSNGSSYVALTPAIRDGNWHNIVITYNSSATNLIAYTDGVETYNATYNAGTNNVIDRISEDTYANYWKGYLDELAVWDSELSAGAVTTIYNGGKPKDLSGLSPVSWWRMGEEATYDGTLNQFTIPDQAGTNNGTSSNTMLLETLVGDSPQYYGGGISDSMDIFDRVGDAPNSENNTVSFNMEEADIVEDTP